MNILIVDNNKKNVKRLQTFLNKKKFFQLSYTKNIEEAAKITSKMNIDLIIIDIAVCKSDEWIFLDSFRHLHTNIIYLTECQDETTIEKAVSTNPIGYLLKPFNEVELYVLLKLIQNKFSAKNKIVKLDEEFSFNTQTKKLYKNHKLVKLSKKESELLVFLINAQHTVVSFETIETLWELPPKPSTLRTMIYRVRTKLDHKFIVTVANEGLKIEFVQKEKEEDYSSSLDILSFA